MKVSASRRLPMPACAKKRFKRINPSCAGFGRLKRLLRSPLRKGRRVNGPPSLNVRSSWLCRFHGFSGRGLFGPLPLYGPAGRDGPRPRPSSRAPGLADRSDRPLLRPPSPSRGARRSSSRLGPRSLNDFFGPRSGATGPRGRNVGVLPSRPSSVRGPRSPKDLFGPRPAVSLRRPGAGLRGPPDLRSPLGARLLLFFI